MLVLTGSNVGLAAWGHGGVGWGLKLIRVIRAVDWAICAARLPWLGLPLAHCAA